MAGVTSSTFDDETSGQATMHDRTVILTYVKYVTQHAGNGILGQINNTF